MFKKNDRVTVISGQTTALGQNGTIISVDEEWVFPFEVKFDSGETYDQELFSDEQLRLIEDLQIEPQSYINIKFQQGTVKEKGVNGVTTVDVIDYIVDILEGHQKGKLACRENDMAIVKLEEARMWLCERTNKRKEKGVEGKKKKHG